MIFTLIAMIIIFLVAYAFLVNLLEAGNEYIAFDALKDSIEEVCDPYGPVNLTINIYLPNSTGQAKEDLGIIEGIKYFYIELTKDGELKLRAEDHPANGVCEKGWINRGIEECPVLKKARLSCPTGTSFEYACIRPSSGIGESIDITIHKEILDNRQIISLVGKSGAFKC